MLKSGGYFACAILAVAVSCSLALGIHKFLNHERNQQAKIVALTDDVSYLKVKLSQTVDYYNFQTEYSDTAYNYLAIGNSLTLIPSWGHGICATMPDSDYFGIVVNELEKKCGTVIAYPINYAIWERIGDRQKALDLLNPYLDKRLNLVTIQLGENAMDLTNYESDLEELIAYVKQSAPDAIIALIGDWWNHSRNELRKQAASSSQVLFVDLFEIVGDSRYQSVTGTKCLLSNGTTVTVSQKASTHPGDLGMKYIASKVLRAITPYIEALQRNP